MEGKIICNIAISLDGYIADEHDGYDWIQGHHDSSLDSIHPYTYEAFLETIDVVVMGKRCFDLKMHEQFKDQRIMVLTHQTMQNQDNVEFLSAYDFHIIKNLKQQGKNVYVFGGGVLVSALLKEQLIDEFIIGIIPVLLGTGIKLFHTGYPTQSLALIGTKIEDGIVLLFYHKR